MHVVVSKTAKVSIDLKEFHCTHARVGVAGACPRARQELIRLRLFIPKLFCSEPVVRVAGKPAASEMLSLHADFSIA